MPSARDGSGHLSSNLGWIGQAAPVDEAHFRAEAELRGKWVLKGEPALVVSTSPQYGEKASYYSATCLETVRWNGWMLRQAQQEGNSNSENIGCFPGTVRRRRGSRLNVIWDNAPVPLRQAQEGERSRE